MVTLPTETASDYMAVHQLISAGMDIARINCSHDCDASWAGMVRNLRDAARASGRPCRIQMDISGPKLRTGPMQALPPVIRLTPDQWDGALVPILNDEVMKDHPGQIAVLDRILDLVVVSALRAWFDRPEAEPPTWYRAGRYPPR